MPKEMKIINHKQNFIFASVILFVVLSCTLVINAVLHNSQAEWAIIPDIKFVGEYKIGDGSWQEYRQGMHLSANQADIILRGKLTKKIAGIEENGIIDKQTVNAITDVYEFYVIIMVNLTRKIIMYKVFLKKILISKSKKTYNNITKLKDS